MCVCVCVCDYYQVCVIVIVDCEGVCVGIVFHFDCDDGERFKPMVIVITHTTNTTDL